MALTTLDPASAFTEGCDLWVAPMANNSPHSGLIDWYINGQMTKALSHTPPTLEPALNNIIRENDLDLVQPAAPENSATLIATQNRLPTQWILMVDFSLPVTKWVRVLSDAVHGLQTKSIRLFAGPDFEFGHFEKSWNQTGRSYKMQIVRN